MGEEVTFMGTLEPGVLLGAFTTLWDLIFITKQPRDIYIIIFILQMREMVPKKAKIHFQVFRAN